MPRWEGDAAGRLEAAAAELFAERGYERTTVADIAARAGLTKRSFFNHFADKREVLFRRRAERQQAAVRRGILAAAEGAAPLEAVVQGLRTAAADHFDGHRDEVLRRERIVAAHPELQERELAKRAALTGAIAEALAARGLPAEEVALVARVGALVQQTAMEAWLEGEVGRPLGDLLTDALAALRGAVDGARR